MTLQPDPTRTPEPRRPSPTSQELNPQSLNEMAAWIDGGGDSAKLPDSVRDHQALLADWQQAAVDVQAVTELGNRERSATVPEGACDRVMVMIERRNAVEGETGRSGRRPTVLARLGRQLAAAAAVAFALWAGFELGVAGLPAGAPQVNDHGVASSLFDVVGGNGVWSDIGDDPFVLMLANGADRAGGAR